MSEEQYNRAYFDGDSKQGYHPPGYQNFSSNYNIVEAIKKLNPKSVLELGGGRGYISHILNSYGIESTCLDIAPHCYHTRACENFVLADATQPPLPFTDKQFDLVFSKDFLEHIDEDDLPKLINEMERVSKRGFHLITFSDHPHAKDDPTHKTLCSKEFWTEILMNHTPNYGVADVRWATEDMVNEDTLKELNKMEILLNLPLQGSKHWSRRAEYPWAIKNASDTSKEINVLNAGSGTDILGFYLNEYYTNANIVNLDNNPEVIAEGMKLAKGTDITFRVGDICNIPYKDNYFDRIFCISVLEHFPNQSDRIKGFKELIRVLKPKGVLVLTVDIGDMFISKQEIEEIIDGILPEKPYGTLVAELPNKEGNLSEISVVCIKVYKSNHDTYECTVEDKEKYEHAPVIPQSDDKFTKLNIGSFINMCHYGWVNIDKLDLSNFAKHNGYIFKQHDCISNIPYENNTVDLIVASHFLEHLDRNEGLRFLTDCARVLKPGGTIRLTVPDIEILVDSYQTKTLDRFKHINIGVEKSTDDAQSLYELMLSGHKTIYDFSSISKLLRQVGFENIVKTDFGHSLIEQIRNETIDMYPTLSLYVEAQYNKKSEPAQVVDLCGQIIQKELSIPHITHGNLSIPDKLRIALISTPFFTVPPKGYSGLEMVVWDLAEALDELGHHVRIFGPEGSRSTKHGYVTETGPSINTVNSNWFEEEKKRYEVYSSFLSHEDSEHYDIIHDHTWFGFAYMMKLAKPNLKIIHTHHGGFSWETPPPISKPNLVAISNYMKQYTEQYFRQKGYNTASNYVYNGIDLKKYPYNNTKSDRLLFVGRLSTFKQPHVAVEIAKKTNSKLDIVGGTFVDSVDYVKQLEDSIRGNPNITLYKDASHEKKIELLTMSKALLFPSKMGEPFGLVALEAMACGTPVIALNDGAISEVVINQKTGFVCNSVDEMIHIVREHINDIEPSYCAQRARQLSRKVMAENYVKLYHKILRGEEW